MEGPFQPVEYSGGSCRSVGKRVREKRIGAEDADEKAVEVRQAIDPRRQTLRRLTSNRPAYAGFAAGDQQVRRPHDHGTRTMPLVRQSPSCLPNQASSFARCERTGRTYGRSGDHSRRWFDSPLIRPSRHASQKH